MPFCLLLIISKSTFSKNSFRNTIRVSNSLDPGQLQHLVRPDAGPDLGPNCLQRLSADDTCRFLFVCLNRFFTSQSTIFQLCWDGSSWVEPELSRD